MTTSPQSISRMLTESGIKPSAQRIAVTGHLMTHRTHPTADDIYQALLPDYPTMSRTTVYNTLKRLAEAGKIKVLDFDPVNQRFDGNTDEHAHFVCNDCGAIHDIESPAKAIAQPDGYLITETQILFRGKCAKCLAKETN